MGLYLDQEFSVTVSALPSSPAALSKARWEDIAPYFDDLAERPLDETTVEGWLRAGPRWKSWSPRRRRWP